MYCKDCAFLKESVDLMNSTPKKEVTYLVCSKDHYIKSLYYTPCECFKKKEVNDYEEIRNS